MLRPGNWQTRPVAISAAVAFLLLLILGGSFHDTVRDNASALASRLHGDHAQETIQSAGPRNDKLHLLMPASEKNVDLCKTILTAANLGYPMPTLIAWNQSHEDGKLLGGGSHVAKISGVVEYLDAMDRDSDNDLIMMLDAYDIWFQLRPEVLISRYHAINAAANKRLAKRLGPAKAAEKIEQTIIFGAGKRCAPNQMHTLACYPIPDSPLPDIYGPNTDTVMGRNKYTSHKQRYLNSGYIIGPAKDMRKMFARAWEKAQAVKDEDEWDNGSHGSDFMYHGSDQSIFNTMLGEQEYQREVMRRRHLSSIDRARGRGKPIPHYLEGTLIRDPLNPPFTHEPGVAKEGKPDEFGMGLDYFSELGHQTVNTEEDVHYLNYDQDIAEQIKNRKGLFDCKSRVNGTLASDILASEAPLAAVDEESSWRNVSLYTNLCLNTVPVMIHHNGIKDARHYQWPDTWMQPVARKLFDKVKADDINGTLGAWMPDGSHMGWDELWEDEWEWEMFRDVPRPE